MEQQTRPYLLSRPDSGGAGLILAGDADRDNDAVTLNPKLPL